MMQSDEATAERAVQHLQKIVGVREATAIPRATRWRGSSRWSSCAPPPARYAELLDVVQLYHATVVDETADAIIVELTGSEAFVLSCIRALERFEIIEVARSGAVALDRRPRSCGWAPNLNWKRARDERATRSRLLRRRHRPSAARRTHLRDRRLRQPGPCPRAQPAGQRRAGHRRPPGRRAHSAERAKAAGLDVRPVAAAAAAADTIMMLVPDQDARAIYERDVAAGLARGKTLMFAHGFNIHYGEIAPPAGVDVSMVAPKSPGHLVRSEYEAGRGVPALVAVHQDASGQALANALAYASGIGCARAGVIETSFREETETDLFGEQAVLCGGVTALVKAGFETLTAAGYRPEMAYFECLHELKLIVDLMYRGGMQFMRYSISDTAEYGDYTRGPRIITEETRAEMRRILEQVQDGSFAREWLEENRAGRQNFERLRQEDRDHLIEQVGAKLRAMMPWSEEGEGRRGGGQRGRRLRLGRTAGAGAAVPPPRRPAAPLSAHPLRQGLGRPRRPRGRRGARPAVRRSPPGARGHFAPGLRGPASGGAESAPARAHHRHGRSQRAHRRPESSDRRPGRRDAGRDPGAERGRGGHRAARSRLARPGHRPCDRSRARRHPAGRGHRLRRLAHLHPRRVRRAGLRHRHQRSGARAGDPVHRAVAAPGPWRCGSPACRGPAWGPRT